MCCFSGSVREVSQTRIFARAMGRGADFAQRRGRSLERQHFMYLLPLPRGHGAMRGAYDLGISPPESIDSVRRRKEGGLGRVEILWNPLPALNPPTQSSQKPAPMRTKPMDDGESLRWDRANTQRTLTISDDGLTLSWKEPSEAIWLRAQSTGRLPE